MGKKLIIILIAFTTLGVGLFFNRKVSNRIGGDYYIKEGIFIGRHGLKVSKLCQVLMLKHSSMWDFIMLKTRAQFIVILKK